MEEKDILLEGWKYDLWANETWLAAAKTMPDPTRPLEILEHIAWGQTTWLSRVADDFHKPEGPLDVRLGTLHTQWSHAVRNIDLRKVFAYQNTQGNHYKREFGAIVRHVIDHGTYHRGQLRGIAEMQNWSDFPETGLAGFHIHFNLHT